MKNKIRLMKKMSKNDMKLLIFDMSLACIAIVATTYAMIII